jgi:hypothetical protein
MSAQGNQATPASRQQLRVIIYNFALFLLHVHLLLWEKSRLGSNDLAMSASTTDISRDHTSPAGHSAHSFRRSYQACIHCRKRKVKCTLDDNDPRGFQFACIRCNRERRQCVFNAGRRSQPIGEGNTNISRRVFHSPNGIVIMSLLIEWFYFLGVMLDLMNHCSNLHIDRCLYQQIDPNEPSSQDSSQERITVASIVNNAIGTASPAVDAHGAGNSYSSRMKE